MFKSNVMIRLLQKIDFVLVIRLIMGGMFLVIAWQFKDWVPAIFGVLMIVIGIYSAKTKTGCGYGGGSCSIRN